MAALMLCSCGSGTPERGHDADERASVTTTAKNDAGAARSDAATEPAPTTAAPRPTTPIPPSGDRRVRLGETGLSEGVAITAHSVAFDPCSHDPYRAAAPGNTIMFVDVTIENRSNPAVPGYDGFDWVLFDAEGNRYHDNYMVPCRP